MDRRTGESHRPRDARVLVALAFVRGEQHLLVVAARATPHLHHQQSFDPKARLVALAGILSRKNIEPSRPVRG